MRTRLWVVLLALGCGLSLGLGCLAVAGGARPARASGSLLYVAPGASCAAAPCYGDVQAAVDAAAPGDEIRVAQGIYHGVQTRQGRTQMVYLDKSVTLRGGYSTGDWSQPDPQAHATVLDAQGAGRVLVITGRSTARVEGLRLTNGRAFQVGTEWWDGKQGGGVYVISAAPTLQNNWIYSNTAEYGGGGAAAYDSTATFSNNEIFSNTAPLNRGGGMFTISTTLTIAGNQIVSNTAHVGGGLALGGSDQVSGNTIAGNHAVTTFHDGNSFEGAGGGVSLEGYLTKQAVLRDNTLKGNTSTRSGGGIYLESSAASVIHNQVLQNSAVYYGGGLDVNFSQALIQDNTFQGNVSGYAGGGLSLLSSQSRLINNLVQGNSATERGGGLWISSADLLDRNRVLGNHAYTGGGIYALYGAATLLNTVIADNNLVVPPEYVIKNPPGSALYLWASSPRLSHTTIARNGGGQASAIYIEDYVYPEYSTFQHSTVAMTDTILVDQTIGITSTGVNTVTLRGILWHNVPAHAAGSSGLRLTAQNQLDASPQFAADGYHLLPGSPAVDHGIPSGVDHDLDGQPRPVGQGYDLGADEVMPAALFQPSAAGGLVVTDTQGLRASLLAPAGAVTQPVTITFVPLAQVTAPFGKQALRWKFELQAERGGQALSGLAFNPPATIELHYTPADLGGLDPATLELLTWDAGDGGWVPAACGATQRHPTESWLSVPVCHLSRFALFAQKPGYGVFLPRLAR